MKRFIVTGASRGIGLEMVKSLLERNIEVIAVARSADKLEELKSSVNDTFLTILPTDLTRREDLARLIVEVKQRGLIDGLVNNAGLLINKPFLQTTREEWITTFDVNVFSVVELVRELMPHFAKNSHIVNIGSMGGFQGSVKYPGLSAYSSSKGALAILTECLSAELAGTGISVNCLCLGAVETEMFRRAFPGFSAPVLPSEMGRYIADFAATAHSLYNGKIIPVAIDNPK